MTRELQASFAFVERNFNLSKRYWGWEVAWLIYSVAGALSVSLIGRSMNNEKLLLTLVIGTIFWSYLAIVFEFIAEAVQWERWEGTLEYTFMAPVRRYAQLFGAAIYAVAFGLVHTIFVLVVLALFFELDLSSANFATAAVFTLLGTFSLRGDRDRRVDPAADVCRARRPDGLRHPVAAAPHQRRVLQRGDPARLDAVPLALQPGDLCPRRGACRTHRRGGDRVAVR